jgi:hypothetical protein
MHIRKCRIAGITRLREKAQVREAEPSNQIRLFDDPGGIGYLPVVCMDSHAYQQAGVEDDKEEKTSGFSHDIIPAL